MLKESNEGSRHLHTTVNGALARGTTAFDNIVKKLRTRDTELRRVKKQLETAPNFPEEAKGRHHQEE
jgi:hypothetical protein